MESRFKFQLTILAFAILTLVFACCEPLPGQGDSCTVDPCPNHLECSSYYGVGGDSGPLFASCEIPCRTNLDCPIGQVCCTIYDGPGQVCCPCYQ